MNPKIIIVNEKDEIIGLKERGTLEQEDIYRVSGLWIENSKGEILLAKRALTKKQNPGKWGPAVAGTFEEGETYESNIIKEAEEEIGLMGADFKKGPKLRVSAKHNYFAQWFLLNIDRTADEFKIKEDEVMELKWVSKDELFQWLDDKSEEFVEGLKNFVKNFWR